MKIDFIQPYSFDLHIGDVYNKAIRECDEWICLTDQDTLKPPGFAERIHRVLQDHGDKKTLYGAMTNRVGWDHPAVVKEMFLEDSILAHMEVAKALWLKHETAIEPTEVVPGYCMLFHRELVEDWPLFHPQSIGFDRIASKWSRTVLMKGIYIVHLYRYPLKDPSGKTSHLHHAGHLLK